MTGQIHRLRHTYCSRLAMAGVPAMAIKELAGHASLSTTQRYMHLSPSAKGLAVAALEKQTAAVLFGDSLETADAEKQ